MIVVILVMVMVGMMKYAFYDVGFLFNNNVMIGFGGVLTFIAVGANTVAGLILVVTAITTSIGLVTIIGFIGTIILVMLGVAITFVCYFVDSTSGFGIVVGSLVVNVMSLVIVLELLTLFIMMLGVHMIYL